MTSQPGSSMPPGRRVAWVILGLSLIGVFVGTVMPQAAVAWLRVRVPLFALTWDSLDALMPWFNPLHILLYAWVAALWRGLSPSIRSRWILLYGGIFGLVTEALQLLAPGRTARPGDVLNDVVGIALGLLLVSMFRKMFFADTRTE